MVYYFSNLSWLFDTNYLYQVSMLIIVQSLFHLPSIYFLAKKKTGLAILFWIALEYFHLHFGLPITILGHHLAGQYFLFGMLKFTGILGFSLLILSINGILINIFFKKNNYRTQSIYLSIIGGLAILTFVKVDFSPRKTLSVLSINSQLTCPVPKYAMSPFEMLYYYQQKIQKWESTEIDLIVLPENAFDNYGFLSDSKDNFINKELLKMRPDASFAFGAISKAKARPMQNTFAYENYPQNVAGFYNYNSTILLDQNKNLEYRHKYKLVPFNENIPPLFNRFLSTTVVGYKFFKKPYYNPTTFNLNGSPFGSVICYESLFGTFVSEFVLNGANFLSFHYNEGWYKSESGSKKMLAHAKIRAAETCKYVVGSSNVGFNFFIDTTGKLRIAKKTDIYDKIQTNNYVTFYTKNGDWIGVIAIIIIFILGIIQLAKRRVVEFNRFSN